MTPNLNEIKPISLIPRTEINGTITSVKRDEEEHSFIESFEIEKGFFVEILKCQNSRLGKKEIIKIPIKTSSKHISLLFSVNSTGFLTSHDLGLKTELKTGCFAIFAESNYHLLINKFDDNYLLKIHFSNNWIWEKFSINPEELFLLKTSENYFFSTLTVPLINSIFKIFCTNQSKEFRETFLKGKSLEIISLYLDLIVKRKKTDSNYKLTQSDIRRVYKLIKFIENNLDKNLSVVSLSSIIGYSETKLQKLFKAIFNMSVHKKVTEIKMTKALEMLSSSSNTVSEIGYKLGYHNMSHFSNAFRKINGFLPSNLFN